LARFGAVPVWILTLSCGIKHFVSVNDHITQAIREFVGDPSLRNPS